MKKFLAILLTLCLVVCMIPGAAFADENTKTTIGDANVLVNGSDNCIYDTDIDVSGESKTIKADVIKVRIGADETFLTEGIDYTLTTDISETTVNIRVVGCGNYTGEVVKSLDIKSKIDDTYFISENSADKAKKDDFITACTYTGEKVIPKNLKLYKKDGGTLKEITGGYTVSVDAANVGTRTVTFTGTGKLIGTVSKSFALEAADIANVEVIAPAAKTTDTIATYQSKISVKLSNNVLPASDYSVAIKKDGDVVNSNATFAMGSKYTVVVTPTSENLTGTSKTKDITVQQGYTGGDITVTDNAATYDGKEHKATLKIGNNSLPSNYVVKYKKDNTLYNAAVGAGVYTIVVTDDKGGSTEAGTYTVNQLDLTKTTSATNYGYISGLDQYYSYANKPVEPTFTVYWNKSSVALKKGTDYTVRYANNTSVGTGTIIVNFMGNFTGYISQNFTIQRGNELSDFTVYVPTISDQTYTGLAVKPYISVYYGGATAITARTPLTEGVHYTLSYSSNIYPGTATVTITGKGSYTGTLTKTFKIKYNLSTATVTTTPAAYAYDGTAKKPAVTVKVGTRTVPSSDYDVTYLNNTNVGTATAIVTAKKYGDAIGSNTANFTITGKTGAIAPEYAAYDKKTTKSSPFSIRIISNTTDGTGYSYTSSDTSVATVSALGTVTVKGCGKTIITITTTGNRAYNPATTTVTVTVKPTKGIITSLTSTAKGKMAVKYKKESPNADYYQIRYGRAGVYNVKTVKNSTALTGKSTIKNLKSGKKYYVKVRGVKELADGTVLYGNWSTTKNVVTK